MRKIREEIDLSRQVLEIDIESPVFNGMLHDLNKEIRRGVDKVYDEEFESAEITVKLTLEIPQAYKHIPTTNEDGELVNETYLYRKPYFKHKISTVF